MSDLTQRYLDERPDPPSPSHRPATAPAPAGGPRLPAHRRQAAAAAPAIVIEGTLMEPAAQILTALGLKGKRSIDKGTEERIRSELDGLGYQLEIKRGAQTVLKLRQYRIIRKIYIKGNWPLFEEEILRRLRFRPGQRLPEGQELVHAISRQEERMKRFLSREGYFEGNLRIQITPSGSPAHVNLAVELFKGRRYKVGDVAVTRGRQMRRAGGRRLRQQQHPVPGGDRQDLQALDHLLPTHLQHRPVQEGRQDPDQALPGAGFPRRAREGELQGRSEAAARQGRADPDSASTSASASWFASKGSTSSLPRISRPC